MVYLDINDWQLTARADDGKVLFRESVGASTATGKLQFGKSALRHSRSHPQQFNNKYFYSLSADPISGDLRPAKNHADLIYHHLVALSLDADKPITLCVSGHLTNQQLGLLLGICQEAKLTISGFIDIALGQSLAVVAHDDYHVLDIELHRMTLSRIAVTENSRQQRQTVTVDGVGVANIIEGWMNVVADEFVQKTRFDPLHAGQSEQQLFDQVTAWLDQPALTDQRASVANGESNRDIEIGQHLLLDKLRQRLLGFDFDHVENLIITPRTAGIPGLQQLLAERIAVVTTLNENDIARNYDSLAQDLDKQDIKRITQATVKQSSAALTQHVATPTTGHATHLLAQHTAYALDHESYANHLDALTARTLSLDVSVNGESTLGLQILPGDSVSIAGQAYTAIRLE